MADDLKGLKCSFCGNSFRAVNIVAGPGVSICSECVLSCNDIFAEELATLSKKNRESIPKPKDIFNYLEQYVIGQSDAKKALSVAVYNHYKRISPAAEFEKGTTEISKSNVLLMGPTGTGKTYLAKILAKIMDVPFVVVDATSLTEAGFIGEDVDSILVYLLQAAEGDVEAAERGIIYIDEIDKIARKGNSASNGRDVSGEGVQQGLLKIIEGAQINIPISNERTLGEKEKTITLDTSNILFICSGAFVGLDEIVNGRKNKAGVGFGAELKKETSDLILKDAEIEDLQKFGMIPEFIGRLPVITSVEPLTKEQLVEILSKPKNSIVKQYQKLFELDNVELQFENDALELIAELAMKRKTGARGLRAIVEKLLNSTMFELPSLKDIGLVIVTKESVEGFIKDGISSEVQPTKIAKVSNFNSSKSKSNPKSGSISNSASSVA